MEPVLTIDQFKTLAKAMKAVYPQPTFLPDEWAAKVWYGLLSDIPYQILQNGVQKHMMTSPYPPTIADLRKSCLDFTASEEKEMTELEAWSLVRKSIARSNYYAEDEFDKLPELCRKTVGSPDNLREWASMDIDTVDSVEQSHFVRNYRAMVQREKELSQLSPKIRERIEALIPRMTIAQKKEPEIEQKKEYIPMPETIRKRLGMQEINA